MPAIARLVDAVERALNAAIALLSLVLLAALVEVVNRYILEVAGGLFRRFATGPVVFLLFVTGVFLFLETFMDPAPAMLVFVPVIAPIADQLRVHPLLLGIVVVMTLSIGKITPPYGISLLLACSIARIPLSESMRWTLAFLAAFCLLVAALILRPPLTLVLPRLLVPELAGG